MLFLSSLMMQHHFYRRPDKTTIYKYLFTIVVTVAYFNKSLRDFNWWANICVWSYTNVHVACLQKIQDTFKSIRAVWVFTVFK